MSKTKNKSIRSVIIYPSGETIVKPMPGGMMASVDHLRDAVGGRFNLVPFPNTSEFSLWINDEGKLENLPKNHKATKLWYELWDRQPQIGFKMQFPQYNGYKDFLVGNVVITGGEDQEGNQLDIPKWLEELATKGQEPPR